ncbi:head GIN domain-containing protein [Flavobacterium sp. SM2513]|uniref:head GIN domain-containing protein n=1 Tax=Flavobacterium sp. SM2513 TaxID=3424766 RepID=UPI003D7FF071
MKSNLTLITKIALVFIAVLSLGSCRHSFNFEGVKGNGTITTETRTITENFDKIHVNSGIRLEVTQTENRSVEVETDENIQALITTTVENGILKISSNSSNNSSNGIFVRVHLPIITELKSSSGASIRNENTLKSTSLTVDSSSGSDIDIEVEADFISMESSSGSSITTAGKALKAETASSSGSSIHAEKLLTNEIFSQASSGSFTKVNPILSLNAKASSGSSIRYINIPKNLDKKESSGGSISKD